MLRGYHLANRRVVARSLESTFSGKTLHSTPLLRGGLWLAPLALGALLFACSESAEEKDLHPEAAQQHQAAGEHGSSTHESEQKQAHGAASGGHSAHWGYEGDSGPKHWGDLKADYVMCKKGKSQSPIDLSRIEKVEAGALDLSYAPIPLEIVNNGHTIQVNNSAPGSLKWQGSEYALAQLHFHAPSEHTRDGRHFDMEVHLVHKSAEGKLAVIGVLGKKGAENSSLTNIWERIPTELNKPAMAKDLSLDLMELLPKNQAFFAYSGSLTTPPCSEGVQWFVLQQPIEVSEAQINRFLEVIHANSRPTQPLEGREITRSE